MSPRYVWSSRHWSPSWYQQETKTGRSVKLKTMHIRIWLIEVSPVLKYVLLHALMNTANQKVGRPWCSHGSSPSVFTRDRYRPATGTKWLFRLFLPVAHTQKIHTCLGEIPDLSLKVKVARPIPKRVDLGVHTELVPFWARTALKRDLLFCKSKKLNRCWLGPEKSLLIAGPDWKIHLDSIHRPIYGISS